MKKQEIDPQVHLEHEIKHMQAHMKSYREDGADDTEGHSALQRAMAGALIHGDNGWRPETADDWGIFSDMDFIKRCNIAHSLNETLSSLLTVITKNRADGFVAARVRNYCWRVDWQGVSLPEGEVISTNDPKTFLGWFPEIGAQIFDHFKVEAITVQVVGKDGKLATFKLEGK